MKRLDAILIGLYMTTAISISYYSLTVEGDALLNVTQKGRILYEAPLSEVAGGTKRIRNGDVPIRLEVGDGQVRMLPMPLSICPQQICLKTGWTDGSIPIVCLPNQITVELTNQKSEEEIDGISY